MKLSELPLGTTARIVGFLPKIDKKYQQQLMALGLIKGTTFTVTQIAPFGDLIAISVRGFSLALRKHEAQHLEIERV